MSSCCQRFFDILSLSVSACVLGALLVVGSSLLPIPRTPPSPVFSAFNISISPLMRAPLPHIYAQGVRPLPMRDYLLVQLTAKADFTPVWDWNTKAIYVACIGRYSTEKFVDNEVTLFDVVLKSKEAAANWVLEKEQKYPLEESNLGTIAGARVQVVFRYQPLRHCGHSKIYEVSPTGKTYPVFRVPTTYTPL